MIRTLLIVGVGGMLGSMFRYGIAILFKDHSFPTGTLLVNIVGSFVIGMIAGLAMKNVVSPELRLFAATGICGGFTTFSAFSMDCVQLLTEHKYGLALLYILSSFAVGIIAAFLGWMLTK